MILKIVDVLCDVEFFNNITVTIPNSYDVYQKEGFLSEVIKVLDPKIESIVLGKVGDKFYGSCG
jgi:hypothetical protein